MTTKLTSMDRAQLGLERRCRARDWCSFVGTSRQLLVLGVLLFLPALDASAQARFGVNCPPDLTNWICGVNSVTPVAYPTPSTFGGNCSVAPVVICSPPSGARFVLGTTTVNCVATNRCGERAECGFLVRVSRDNTPPAIRCPTNLAVTACNRAGVAVNYPAPAATDNVDPSPLVECAPKSGSVFPVGATVVTCKAGDACGNSSTCTFTVTVNLSPDTAPPVIHCPPDIELWTCSTSAVTHYAVTASDSAGGEVPVACVPPVGTPLPVGSTTVFCTATNDCGGASQCSFQVRVRRDTTPPVIACPSNIVFNCLCPGQAIALDFFKAEAVDDHDPNPTVVCDPPSLISSPGVHVITCTATDDCGNSSRCQFTVTFNYDTTPPVIHCPGDLVAGTCGDSAVVRYNVSASDDCSPDVKLTCAPPSGSRFPLGTTTVVCIAEDRCTNRSSCTFTVKVNRVEQPRSDLGIVLRNGHLVVNWDENTATGALESARDPAGPWSEIVGASAPYSTRPVGPHRFFRIAPCTGTEPPRAGSGTFSARVEEEMGTWLMLPQSDWMFTRGREWSFIRSGARSSSPVYRSMSGNFLVPANDTPIAVFFTAEAYVEGVDKRLFVRALVDGVPMNPGDVVFATGTSPVNPESRSFAFVDRANAGLHTLDLQWLVDAEGTGYIRDAAFLVRVGDSPNRDGSVQVYSPPSGPSESTTVAAWVDVPGLGGTIVTEAGDSLAISVSAESYTTAGGTMFLRALVDGQPAKPSDVLFAKGAKPQCRLMTFGLNAPDPGVHNVRIQWQADGGGAFVGDRSLVLAVAPKAGTSVAQVFVAPDSGAAESTSSITFAPVPGLSATGTIPPNGEVAVHFSAVTSVPAGERLVVRLTVDGVPVPESEAQLAESDAQIGVHSYVFSAKHLYAENPPPASSTVGVEWRVENGNPVFLDDRTMTVLVKRPTVPDLAEPSLTGLGNTSISPAVGARRLLVILWDPHRTGHPAPPAGAIKQAVFGANDSIQNYYDVVSRGKYSLNNALGGNAVLGWYDATGPVTDYFNSEPDCDSGGTKNGQDVRRREALLRAAQDIDFAAFDDNMDGVLDPQLELGVLLVMPDNGTANPSGKVRNVRAGDCGWLSVDGVVVPLIAEWLTDGSSGDFMVATHELAHLMLNLDDMYLSSAVPTRAGRYSLMEAFNSNHTPHPDALNKLSLGWVSPTIIQGDGIHALQDVKKSGEVIVLPRTPGKATDEYFLLENRQTAADNTFYDQSLVDSGVAVWHVIAGPADNGLPPACLTPADWSETGNGNARRGNRLLRPQLSSANNLNALWNDNHYDLLDTGLVCPDDAASATDRRNVLRWADGTASGFNLLNWPASAETMTFQIIAP